MKNDKERLILVANDDGYDAPGVHVLAERLSRFGNVICVCPATQESGQSMALTLTKPLTFEKVDEKDNILMYKVQGTPVDCVALAVSTIIGRKPDMVATGVNLGPNASANMLFSGTMGAASMGCLFGIPSVGFSLDSFDPNASFDNCLPFIDTIAEGVINHGLPAGVCLNVNIPAGEKRPERMRLATLCKAGWQAGYKKITSSDGKISYRPYGDFINEEPENTETDIWCLEHNIVSVTPVMLDRVYPHREEFGWI